MSEEQEESTVNPDIKIKVTKNGPYIVSGSVSVSEDTIITDDNGDPVKWEKTGVYSNDGSCALCRCGQSNNKPYCDSSHIRVGFDGTETAEHVPYSERAEIIEGPDLILTDVKDLCSSARFCHRAGGTWRLTRESDVPGAKKAAVEQACNCPSGRLVTREKNSDVPNEPDFEPSISLVQDPAKDVSGPIWVKGKIPIESSDGSLYETRNRMTLCRCGKSRNKPFCDGTHIETHFKDK